ncbi:hypothetical protein FKM82_003936 [Ascaphus truei]
MWLFRNIMLPSNVLFEQRDQLSAHTSNETGHEEDTVVLELRETNMRVACFLCHVLQVLLLESVDVEAPEYLSQEHAALVYAKPDPACTHCFISTVPVHARYHRPSAEIRETSFTLRNPQLLIHCSKDFPPSGCPQLSVVEAPCASEAGTACQWLDVPYIPVPKTLTAQVPVGITQHGPAVCFLTLVMTLICTGMIFSAVYKHGHLCA